MYDIAVNPKVVVVMFIRTEGHQPFIPDDHFFLPCHYWLIIMGHSRPIRCAPKPKAQPQILTTIFQPSTHHLQLTSPSSSNNSHITSYGVSATGIEPCPRPPWSCWSQCGGTIAKRICDSCGEERSKDSVNDFIQWLNGMNEQ